jgi:hypothetical protein
MKSYLKAIEELMGITSENFDEKINKLLEI